jgi:hypothetical protein
VQYEPSDSPGVRTRRPDGGGAAVAEPRNDTEEGEPGADASSV